jgi:putative inorganic carbon (HCO3(-)) transporter
MIKIIQNLSAKLASIEIWVISSCVLFSMFYPRALLGVVGIGVFFWFVRWFVNGRFTERTPVDGGVLLLLLMIPVTMWVTALPSITYLQVYRLLTGMLLFYAMVNWTRTNSRLRWMVACTILASFFLALFATISVEWTQQKLLFLPASLYDRFILLVKDTVQRNVMAGNLIILFPISLGLLLFAWKELRGWNRLILTVIVCTIFGILILTQSRGALVALGVVLILLIALRWKWGWIVIPISLAAVGGTIVLWGADIFMEVLSSGVSLEGLQGRLEVWSRAIYMIQDFPFTGIGLGLFRDVADTLYPFFLNAPGSVPHAHNLFLQVAVDLGLPGLIAWASIFIGAIISSWQIYRIGKKQSKSWFVGLGAGFLCTQIALFVHGIFDAVTWGALRPAPILWAVWGLIIACSMQVESWCDTVYLPKKT